MAYFADDRQDLLNGINEFLDYSIVIPPSDVEGKDLLKTVSDFQKQMLRKRKERELKKQQSFTGMETENKGSWKKSSLVHLKEALALELSIKAVIVVNIASNSPPAVKL